jgi:hypothetical protein
VAESEFVTEEELAKLQAEAGEPVFTIRIFRRQRQGSADPKGAGWLTTVMGSSDHPLSRPEAWMVAALQSAANNIFKTAEAIAQVVLMKMLTEDTERLDAMTSIRSKIEAEALKVPKARD